MSAVSTITLPYGGGEVALTCAAGRYAPLRARRGPALRDPARRLATVLDAPIAAPPLRALLRRDDRVTIVVSDQTRATGVRVLLPALLAYLESAGVPPGRVRVLFALGIHRPQTPAEQAAILGPDVAARITHADHACDDADALATFDPGGGVPAMRLHRWILDGSLVIATGAVAFHYLAGFGGGRKALVPGVAGRESVLDFHRLSLAPEAGAGRHPAARPGVRKHNPLDAFAEAVVGRLPRTFLVNTIMAASARDQRHDKSAIAALVAGDMAGAFDHACALYARRFTVPIARRRPVVIVSAGGAPRDCDLVQAQKAIGAAAAALTPGGTMLVLAACPQGTGQAELLSWFEHGDRARHVAALRERFSVPGQTALALREHAERFRIYLRSELPAEVVARTGMIPITRLEEFFDAVARRHGRAVEGYVLPEGVRYLPVPEDER